MQIKDKTAIVTGASSGMGIAFSRALIKQGATVHGLARSTDKLYQVEDELGASFKPVTMDITDHGNISDWVNSTFSEDNTPNILVNNAGLARFADVSELSVGDWEAMIQTNLSGAFYMTRQLIPYMKDSNTVCHIVNNASIAAKVGTPQLSGYNASKFGVRGFTQSLFKEVRYDGIKVTGLYPGSTDTNFFSQNDMQTHENMMKTHEVADVLIDVIQTPDNFLISDVTMRPLNPKPPEK